MNFFMKSLYSATIKAIQKKQKPEHLAIREALNRTEVLKCPVCSFPGHSKEFCQEDDFLIDIKGKDEKFSSDYDSYKNKEKISIGIIKQQKIREQQVLKH